MKVWGFTIIKNAIKYDYPIEESIRSILPLCEKVIVLHGDSEDDTAALLSQIKSPKVKVVDSVWTPDLRDGGEVLAQETNKAMKLIPADVDWCFYIQADEVLHEDYVTEIKSSLTKHLNNEEVKGILFDYKHFYGSYNYIGKNSDWYQNEIRIIRNDPSIFSYRDAQGFRMENNKKLPCKKVNAFIFHYGWVKNPKTMMNKLKDFHKLWHSDDWIQKKVGSKDIFQFEKIDVLEKFDGTHPQVMNLRVSKQDWQFEYDINQNKYTLKDRLKKLIKLITGKSFGEYKNYKLLK